MQIEYGLCYYFINFFEYYELYFCFRLKIIVLIYFFGVGVFEIDIGIDEDDNWYFELFKIIGNLLENY